MTAGRALAATLALLLLACGPPPAEDRTGGDGGRDAASADAALANALERELTRLRAAADSVDAIFQPLPLLRPRDEATLRRYGNDAQLAVAARLGVRPNTAESELQRLVQEGKLVRLADSTELWVVRRLDHSAPYLTPDAERLLRQLAERFQQALAQLGAPAFRLEVTSVLRTAQDQERLRRVNPNAALGRSTHQYGTTFDVAYSAYAAPARPFYPPDVADAGSLRRPLEEIAALMAETVAARRSRELMAVLGKVLLALQEEGVVMVTLEELQPVYHMTVARPLADR